MHDGAGRGVLQVDFLVGLDSLLDRKCSQRRFVKTAQDELFLPGIKTDIANRIDAGF